VFPEELRADAVVLDNCAEDVTVLADPESAEEEPHIVLGYN
jgi:hypothetical protein